MSKTQQQKSDKAKRLVLQEYINRCKEKDRYNLYKTFPVPFLV